MKKIELIVSLTFLIPIIILSCRVGEEERINTKEVLELPIYFSQLDLKFNEIRQMAIDVSVDKAIDSLEIYNRVNCTIFGRDTIVRCTVTSDYKDSILLLDNYTNLIDLESFFLSKLEQNSISELNFVQTLVLKRDPNIDITKPVKIEDTRYIDVSINYVKTCDSKYSRWLEAIDAFCLGNPDYPFYDESLLKKIKSYCNK